MSTHIPSGELVTFSIKINGADISNSIDIKSITINKAVNTISSAIITVIDGDPSSSTFRASSSNSFIPGNAITIEAGYETKVSIIFKGIITKQSIRIDANLGSVLVVECKDEAIKMSVGRKSLTFSNQKDSDIISAIIGTYSGLSSGISATTIQWPEQVQYYTTDWDFILTRAKANGYVVTTLDGKTSVFPPDKNTTPVLNIEYGNNLLDCNVDLNAITQLDAVKASAWDYKNQTIISSKVTNNYFGPGNLSSKTLSDVVGLKDYELQTTAPLDSAELTNWAKAELVKSDYSKIQGDVKLQGSSKVDPGKHITLSGLGDRFTGNHFVSKVQHVIENGNWNTVISVGLSNLWSAQEPNVMSPPTSSLHSGIQGLYNATVKKIYEDPDNQYRILVDIPLFDPNGEGLWARLSNFYATSGAGAFFLPEVGDEVVVGFLNEDPRFPIILGSLYSTTKNEPFSGLAPNEKNNKKAIVSKSNIAMTFDDENVVFTLGTPNKNEAIFSDQDQQITIKDQNGNSIVMSSSGITIKSDRDITIEAAQNLNLKGTQAVTIASSGGDTTLKGLDIKCNADMDFTAIGAATATIEGGAETTINSSGETIINGGVVIINDSIIN